jgi:hypothetical protein
LSPSTHVFATAIFTDIRNHAPLRVAVFS